MADVKESSKNICFPHDTPEEKEVALKIIDKAIQDHEKELD